MRVIGLTLLSAAVVAWLVYFAVYQVDDAFIVYRYARNLAAGEGFVFNPGQRVEGVTCLFWTLALVPFAAVGLPLPRVAPVLSALAGLAVLALLPGTGARLGGRKRADTGDLAASALLACQPAFAYWSVGGLETVPFALLLLLAVRDQAVERDAGGGVRSAVWLGLAAGMRPETPLLAVALASERACWGGAADLGGRLRRVANWLAVVALPFAALVAFRRAYFGQWLPNTYFAKTGGGIGPQLARGVSYTLEFLDGIAPDLASAGVAGTLLGGGLVAGVLGWGLARARHRAAALLVVALGVTIALEGGDWMTLHRFFVPALPLLVMLAVAAAREALAIRPRLRLPVIAFGLLFALSMISAGVSQRPLMARNAQAFDRAHEALAHALRERSDPADEVALMDIGLVGWISGLRIFDLSGLTEPVVAHSPGGFLDKFYPVDTVLDRAPRFVVLARGYPIDHRIGSSPRFQREYREILQVRGAVTTLHLFERERTDLGREPTLPDEILAE